MTAWAWLRESRQPWELDWDGLVEACQPMVAERIDCADLERVAWRQVIVFADWLQERCTEHYHTAKSKDRMDCRECWQSVLDRVDELKELEEGL